MISAGKSSKIEAAGALSEYSVLLLAKSGRIGDIVSADATCTSIQEIDDLDHAWNSICSWGPTALLPIFQILGTEYDDIRIVSRMAEKNYDQFTRISFDYPHAVTSLKVGRGIKSEGELVIAGTKGVYLCPLSLVEDGLFRDPV